MKSHKSWMLMLALLSGLTTQQSRAVPSGFAKLPKVNLPKIDGRTLPVHLWPDSQDDKTIWVEPLEGEFVSEGVVKSPAAKCDVLTDSLRLDELVTKMRVDAAQQLDIASTEYYKKIAEKDKATISIGRLTSAIPSYQAEVAQMKTSKVSLLGEVTKLNGELDGLQTLIAIGRDKDQVAKQKAKAADLDNQIAAKARELLTLQTKIKEKEEALTQMQIDVAQAQGDLDGLELKMTTLNKRIAASKAQIDGIDKDAESEMKKYSNRIGAYATYTAEFAPTHFLEALKTANPALIFRYVPSVTAIVDVTIPDYSIAGSKLEGETGKMILAAKWSDPREARLRDFMKVFGEMKSLAQSPDAKASGSAPIPDPVKRAQEVLRDSKISEVESSLSGTKFLALKLSVLGYCALSEPKSLSSKFTGGSEDTFKLAMYYTFPVNYAIKVHGELNSGTLLYDFYKMTNESSWFGLSNSQKQEHARTLSQSKSVNVTVDPLALGPVLKPGESLLLTNLVKDQLVFFALEPYLDTKGVKPPEMKFDDKQLGAETVGERLLLVPNPWVQWAGLVLTSLAEMFGTSEKIATITSSETAVEQIDYQAGFNFQLSGDITIGNLQQAKGEEREIH